MADIKYEIEKRIDAVLDSFSVMRMGSEVEIVGPVSGFKYVEKVSDLFSKAGRTKIVRDLTNMEKSYELTKTPSKAA